MDLVNCQRRQRQQVYDEQRTSGRHSQPRNIITVGAKRFLACEEDDQFIQIPSCPAALGHSERRVLDRHLCVLNGQLQLHRFGPHEEVEEHCVRWKHRTL